MPAQTRILRQISFTGAPAYSQAELLAFTGLKPGSSATQQQVEDAAQRLGDTGLFEEVNFSGDDRGRRLHAEAGSRGRRVAGALRQPGVVAG